MNRPSINRQYALSVIDTLQKKLDQENVPLVDIILFGSAAKGEAHEWSDIDIAVVCTPFLSSKYDERKIFSRIARTIDVRAEVVCLHPQDFENNYFTLAKEIKKYGISAR